MNRKHLLIMAAGCLMPLAAIIALAVFKVPIGTVATFGLLLLCPLSHLVLMRGMGHKTQTAEATFPADPAKTKPACH